MSATPTSSAALPSESAPVPTRRVKQAIGPKLKRIYVVVLVLLALLVANASYLGAITLLGWWRDASYENQFYLLMFLAHIVLGLLLVVPFLIFALKHMANTRTRRNRRAVRVGYVLFAASLIVLGTGIALLRVGNLELKSPAVRSAMYWGHVVVPFVAGWLYWLHRLAGRSIKWRQGAIYLGVVGAAVLGMVALHAEDPREWNVVGPDSGMEYFEPSLARTASGNFIPADALMNDQYCLDCHADVHKQWEESAHHHSSFNNPVYLASIRETRRVLEERAGTIQASRWCAGCHDPVPFFSGAFDDPKFDDVSHPTSQAGITCTSCHAITNVNSVVGNAAYTIEEPVHYPFASSSNAALKWINHQLVKAKPTFHKETFLKPFHKSAEFCSTCHKVSIPKELNDYREFLRGQNHYDSYLLSGVSGHGARSFYYPPKAVTNCNECHMPPVASDDFGAKLFGDAKTASVHNHLFPGGNTGIAWLKGAGYGVEVNRDYLQDVARVDLFGVRTGPDIDAPLIAPLRPKLPTLKPGNRYLLEAVIRTLKVGHHLTQGTTDSNEMWLEVVVRSGDDVLFVSGEMRGTENAVDPDAHFVRNFVIDRNGYRIARRNPQDIFTSVYNHQIPPGAGWTVHYALDVPERLDTPLTVDIALKYRKFDAELMQFVADSLTERDHPLRGDDDGESYRNRLPVTVIATDSITFPVEGVDEKVSNVPPDIPVWQRWNDFGIGLFLKGKAELKQAAEAFREVEKTGRYDGPLNLARVQHREGQIDEATDSLARAAAHNDPAAPPWVVDYLSGLLNREQGRLQEAAENFDAVLGTKYEDAVRRGFDFGLDYQVRNLQGLTLFDLAKQRRGDAQRELFEAAVAEFERTLEGDPENVTAHYNLHLLYDRLGDETRSEYHQQKHRRYKPDDNARDRAIRLARERYPAANRGAEKVVIYPLKPPTEP